MVRLSIVAEIWPEKRREFLQTMEAVLQETRQEHAKILPRVFQEIDHPNTFYYLEEWDSRPDMDAHVHTDRFQAIIGAMKVLGEIRELKLITAANVEGIEALT